MKRFILPVLIVALATSVLAAQPPAPPPPTPLSTEERLARLERGLADLQQQLAALKANQPTFQSPGSTLETKVNSFGTVVYTYRETAPLPTYSTIGYGGMDATTGRTPRTPVRTIIHRLFPQLGSHRGNAAGGAMGGYAMAGG